MSSVFVNVLVAGLFAAFAIATILFVFAVAGKALTEIVEAFQRSALAGMGLLVAYMGGLFAVAFGIRMAVPYIVDAYHNIFG